MADKIRVTVVFEYEPDPRDYEGCDDIYAMAELDDTHNNWADCPDAYEDALKSVSYEGIPDEG